MSDPATVVTDDVEHDRLVWHDDGLEAELVYRASENNLILVHVGVPDSLSGRGIGGRLVSAALEKAVQTGQIVVPWCPFARKWLRTHPEAADRVEIDWRNRPGAG